MDEAESGPLAQWARRHGVPLSALPELRTLMAAPLSGAGFSFAAPSLSTTALTELPGAPHLALLEHLGAGGMGEVLRAKDHRLERDVALKVLLPRHAHDAALRARFLEEARAQADLAHPGVVPVYEIGVLEDGRPFFTMALERGLTLHQVLTVHRADWTLPRLVDVLRRVAEVVAFAHDRGVIHRDLKPANVMVGAFGEVRVIDWGLVHRASDESAPIAGTPAYLAPEVRQGQVTPASDVFALGAILRDISGASAPEGLRDLLAQAVAEDPETRPTAATLAGALSDWLDGAARRAKALAIVEEAERRAPEAATLREAAAEHEARAAALRVVVPPSSPIAEKAELWAEEDEAERCRRAADEAERDQMDLLTQALSHDPDLTSARQLLAAWHRQELERAESVGDGAASAAAEARLRLHERGEHAAFLVGDGAITLVTDPPGAEARLHRYVVRDRRWVPELERTLGRTPLVEVPVARGAWLVTLHAPGRAVVRVPIWLRRLEHADGVPPEGTEPLAIPLPAMDALGPEDVYVPPGWFWFGQDDAPHQAWPAARRWLHGIVMQRFPVTNARYLAFLDGLVAEGREDEAIQAVPRAQRAQEDDRIEPIYGRRADGTFELVPDGDGDLWLPDWPVIQVDWRSARAFAAWEATRTGLPWRLPDELEWEKAGRGVDGRTFPWGEHFDPTFACTRTSFAGRPMVARVTEFPGDESPYGVRGMAGGVRDWCATRFARPGAAVPPMDEVGDRLLRGGCWHFSGASGCLTARSRFFEGRVSDLIGFRLVRSWPGEET